jgi:hypothetical protein
MNYQDAIREIASDPEKEIRWGNRLEWYGFERYFKFVLNMPSMVEQHTNKTDFEVRSKSYDIILDGKRIALSPESYKQLKRAIGGE